MVNDEGEEMTNMVSSQMLNDGGSDGWGFTAVVNDSSDGINDVVINWEVGKVSRWNCWRTEVIVECERFTG